jgi:predicted methyltransferase
MIMRLAKLGAWTGWALLAGWSATGFAQEGPVPAPIAAAVAAPDRPQTDTDRDGARKPAALLAFAKLAPGERVADIMPGQGYFTRLFSHAVGPGGHVYALVPAELAQVAPKAVDSAKALAADPRYANVTLLIEPTAALAAPKPLDLAWTSDNYHDLYGFFGPDQAAKFDAAVFRMLKPGGLFVVIDHASRPGATQATNTTLHRIDPALVKAQVLAAGFTLDGESAILTNPADPHDIPVFSPTIRGRTDQFVLRFRKPAEP